MRFPAPAVVPPTRIPAVPIAHTPVLFGIALVPVESVPIAVPLHELTRSVQ